MNVRSSIVMVVRLSKLCGALQQYVNHINNLIHTTTTTKQIKSRREISLTRMVVEVHFHSLVF